MSEQRLTTEDARQSMEAHVADKGLAIHDKYGPYLGWEEFTRLLEDRAFVRYPCEIVFNADPLEDGEVAYPVARGETPEEGFRMHVHPYFAIQPERVVALVLYQLVVVNYGPFASSDDAETFGASALGIPRDAYYTMLCEAADELVPPEM